MPSIIPFMLSTKAGAASLSSFLYNLSLAPLLLLPSYATSPIFPTRFKKDANVPAFLVNWHKAIALFRNSLPLASSALSTLSITNALPTSSRHAAISDSFKPLSKEEVRAWSTSSNSFFILVACSSPFELAFELVMTVASRVNGAFNAFESAKRRLAFGESPSVSSAIVGTSTVGLDLNILNKPFLGSFLIGFFLILVGSSSSLSSVGEVSACSSLSRSSAAWVSSESSIST
mmetsp:Transcript_115833/g.182213  ORF Transcript_115833/g.182213 Transcript_115833/m.182213 type:complete len:232 (-) Transcript_115833:157-852(-)